MIGAAALALVLLALALGVAWLVSWPVLLGWRRAERRWPRAASINVLIMGLPLLTGLVVAAGAVWPAHVFTWEHWTCHCTPSRALHLCLVHPDGALPLLPAAAFLLVWLGWRPAHAAVRVARCLLAARHLRAQGTWRADPDAGVLLGALGTPNAFTAGLLRTEVLADRSWWQTLTHAERDIVVAHERAHARCRDLLTHTTGQLLQALAPRGLAGPLLEGWLAFAEQRADAAAASSVDDVLAVADLLVRQARVAPSPSLLPGFNGRGTEGRVRALLALDGGAPRLGSDLGLSLPLLASASLAVGLLGYQIHAALERLLHLTP